MLITILGAGRVGSELAKRLVRESQLTLVDVNGDRLRELQTQFDLRAVQGDAANPAVLREAGCDDADIVVAVTARDESNLVACKICSQLFNTPVKIARIRSQDIGANSPLLSAEGFGVDHVFCPEQIIADLIVNATAHPGCLGVYSFAEGRVSLAAIRADNTVPRDGLAINEFKAGVPDVDFRCLAVYRGDALWPVEADSLIKPGDEIYLTAPENSINTVIARLTAGGERARRVFIAGGGNIGERVARALESSRQVKVLERDRERCGALSEKLEQALVLRGDATDENILKEENVADCDFFWAITDDDEANIMSALLAKRLGAAKVAALVNRSIYADLLGEGRLDVALSPSRLTLGSVLTHLRKGDVRVVHSLGRGAAEAIEVKIHGDAKHSRVVGRRVDEVPWPRGAMPGIIARRDEILIAHHDTVLQSGDNVIVFAPHREAVRRIEALMGVDAGFL